MWMINPYRSERCNCVSRATMGFPTSNVRSHALSSNRHTCEATCFEFANKDRDPGYYAMVPTYHKFRRDAREQIIIYTLLFQSITIDNNTPSSECTRGARHLPFDSETLK